MSFRLLSIFPLSRETLQTGTVENLNLFRTFWVHISFSSYARNLSLMNKTTSSFPGFRIHR